MLIATTATVRGSAHLRVRQTSYDETAKARLQRIGSPARWLAAEWAWDCPLTPASVIELEKAAAELGAEIEWGPGLREYAQANVSQHERDLQVRSVLETMERERRPFPPYHTRQDMPPMRHQAMVWHWSQRVRGILLGHDMGTGKTRESIDAAIGWYAQGIVRPMVTRTAGGVDGGVLVVCPPNVVGTWVEQLAQWCPEASVQVIRSSRPAVKRRQAGRPAHFHVVNYEGSKFVEDSSYDGAIFDECHRLANDTQQMHRCFGLSQRAKRLLCLSGTPISNALPSLYFPMLIVDGGISLGPSKAQYLERFIQGRAPEDAERAVAAAVSTYASFIKKEEVLDLPPKTFTPMYLSMTPDQARYYKTVRDDFKLYIQDAKVDKVQRQAKAMKLWELCQGFIITDQGPRHFSDAKSAAVIDLLINELAGRKVIVWGLFTYEIDRLCDMLRSYGIGHVRLDSTVPQSRRQADVDAWNRDPSIPVFVRQIAISEGQTLLARESGRPCTNAIYLGSTWSYVHWKQSQDRNHRIGQTGAVTYHVLLTDNGLDRAIYERVLSKGETSENVMDYSKQQWISILDGDDQETTT